ncbi:MAG: Signal peptidase [Nocardioides sp.]|uniref:signal peptidase I n=1 Tax=Nocardioides sp. TaxID=35761 RepID=UPI002620F01B|nr:signal peptidase I [Nocardioides sp.]MCW2834059.1 Signal peptidase [Nocardioides sp.]
MTATLASPDVDDAATESSSVASHPLRDWAHLLSVLAARIYRAYLLVLVAIALAPVLFGWGSYVIKSGSMEPSVQVGDVVVAKPYTPDQTIRVGRVFVFDDPASDAAEPDLIVHRIVERRDDGDYTTAGDANEVTDITPLPRTDVVATAVILAPYVGLPVTWAQSGQWLNLVLWLLFSMAAFGLATRNLAGEPPKWGLLRLIRDLFTRDGPSDPDDTPPTTHRDENTPTPPPRSPDHVLRCSPVVVAACTVLLGTLTATANAGFTGNTRNSSMTWSPGPWTQPYVGAVLTDSPSTFWLLDEPASAITAQDRSGSNVLGTYKPTTIRGEAGGLLNNPGTSVRTTGALALTSANPLPSSATHTTEFWFRSGDADGGYLTGFAAGSDGGAQSVEDRVVWMSSTGKITYGNWPTNQQRIIATPLSYNNNVWHHVVVVSTASTGGRQNTVIYVDGSARVSGQTSRVDTYNGYVRVGGGTGTGAFSGSIDNVSTYGTALSAARVTAHWNAR